MDCRPLSVQANVKWRINTLKVHHIIGGQTLEHYQRSLKCMAVSMTGL